MQLSTNIRIRLTVDRKQTFSFDRDHNHARSPQRRFNVFALKSNHAKRTNRKNSPDFDFQRPSIVVSASLFKYRKYFLTERKKTSSKILLHTVFLEFRTLLRAVHSLKITEPILHVIIVFLSRKRNCYALRIALLWCYVIGTKTKNRLSNFQNIK